MSVEPATTISRYQPSVRAKSRAVPVSQYSQLEFVLLPRARQDSTVPDPWMPRFERTDDSIKCKFGNDAHRYIASREQQYLDDNGQEPGTGKRIEDNAYIWKVRNESTPGEITATLGVRRRRKESRTRVEENGITPKWVQTNTAFITAGNGGNGAVCARFLSGRWSIEKSLPMMEGLYKSVITAMLATGIEQHGLSFDLTTVLVGDLPVAQKNAGRMGQHQYVRGG
ncbi:hypothetical protein C8R47DRAFT_1320685 [Mycena vitilis]|nr:hypothetical protein C8R47DRAFT_1320685 [Mycena vitilis]